MKNLLLSLACFCAFAGSVIAQEAPAAPAAPAVEEQVVIEEECSWKPNFSITAEWTTDYMSKGKVVNPDPILSLDFYAELKGFYIDIWAPFDMSGYNDTTNGYNNDRKYRPEEIDYTIGYSYTFGKDVIADFSDLTVDVAWSYYQYPRLRVNGNHYKDNPMSLTLTLDNVLANFTDEESASALAIGTNFMYDLEHYFWYGKVFANYSYQYNEKVSFYLKNTWYWASAKYNGRGNNSLNATEVKVGADYALCDNITLGAFVAGAWAIDQEQRHEWKADTNNYSENFWAGLSCSFSF